MNELKAELAPPTAGKISTPPAVASMVIRPAGGWARIDFGELWEYRELLYFMVWRDLKVRYKQTILGAAWAIIQPVFMMLVFSLFFGKLARMSSDGVPYPVFVYCALLPWQLFATAMTQASNSLTSNEHLITKVYFPRLIVPLAAVASGLVDFAISLGVLGLLLVYFQVTPSAAIWTLPLFIMMTCLTALGVGLWLSALNVRYRDVRYTLGFITQLWLFATPVAYSISIIPPHWRWAYGLNPMVGVIEGFRWAILGKAEPPGIAVFVSLLVTIAVLVGGMYYFRRVEDTLADII